MVEFKGKLGAKQFAARWPNEKAIKVGYLHGRGNSSPAIASKLKDGTTAATIRTQLQRAGLTDGSRIFRVSVVLSSYQRTQLTARAAARGMDLEEWMRLVVINAGIPDDLFDAVVPDPKDLIPE